MCRTTTVDEDDRQLNALEESQPQTVLICSDLHLGPGLDPRTGQIARTENFLQDGAFRRFLAHHRALLEGQRALLIINGDIVDFPRITSIPTTEEDYAHWQSILAEVGCDKSLDELRLSLSAREKRFGLRTNDYKVVWKFDQVVRGHPQFFRALAEWVTAGHDLLYVKGNHDVEVEHPLVRRAFRAALAHAGAPPQEVHERVAFGMDGVRLANCWIEHGHQHEDMTRVVGEAFLDSRPGELNQPLGTFVNRYLLNPIENVRPFINNIKPVQGVLWKVLKHHPVKALSILMRSSYFVPRAIAMARVRLLLGFGLFLLFLIGGWVIGLGVTALLVALASGGFNDFADTAVRVSAVILLSGFAAPILLGVLSEVLARLRDRQVAPYVRDCVGSAPPELAQEGYSLTYVIVGHTHEQDSQRFEWEPLTDSPTMYLNTGTWIPIWDESRPDLHGRTLSPFVRLDMDAETGEYRHRHSQWNDGRGVPEPSVVFSSAPPP